MNINNPTTFSGPNLTLTTSNSSGTAGALRADDSILIYDTTAVDAITFGQSGSVGSAATASRRDHVHAMATATFQTAATEAEMEAASDNTVVVTPGRAKFHPGVAKIWGQYDQTASPQSLTNQYGIGAIDDGGGAGLTNLTWSVAFSAEANAFGTSGNGGDINIGTDDTTTASGIVGLLTTNQTTNSDQTLNKIVGYGNQ